MASRQSAFSVRVSGGRRLTAAVVLFAVLQVAGLLAQHPSTLTVHEDKGVYTVAARFLVDQPASVVLAVLTDYERIPRFMPDVRTSIVRERGAGWAVVEQEAVSSFLMFSIAVRRVSSGTTARGTSPTSTGRRRSPTSLPRSRRSTFPAGWSRVSCGTTPPG
jgi:hypothetical protein